jgi:hypothetical protein
VGNLSGVVGIQAGLKFFCKAYVIAVGHLLRLQNVDIIEFHFSNQKGVPSRSFGVEVVEFKRPPSPSGLRRGCLPLSPPKRRLVEAGESDPGKLNDNTWLTVI